MFVGYFVAKKQMTDPHELASWVKKIRWLTQMFVKTSSFPNPPPTAAADWGRKAGLVVGIVLAI